MRTYPINLVGLQSRICLVVGGGSVACRKVDGLLGAGAQVVVVALEAAGQMHARAAAGEIELRERAYEQGDLDGVFLVIAAAGDRDLNHTISAEAMRRGVLVNVVDDPDASSFIVPAVVRRGDLSLAVSTGGASPALARRLREGLEAQFGPEYEGLVEILAELRPEIMARFEPGSPRLEAALRLVDADLIPLLRHEGKAAALAHARSLLAID